MNTLKSSSVALAAAALAGIGFCTSYHLMSPPFSPGSIDTDETMPDMIAAKAILVIKKSEGDTVAKYLQVGTDIAEDGRSGTLSIIEPGHKLHDLVELEHLSILAEAISLGELLAAGADSFESAVEMLDFEVVVEINKTAAA